MLRNLLFVLFPSRARTVANQVFSREGAAAGDVAQRGAVGYHHAALQWRVQRHVVAYAELDGGWCKCLGVVCFVLRARCLFVGQGASYVAVVCVVTDRT